MILYQLRCGSDHEFEAWFRNAEAYDEQAAAGEIACPLCGDRGVSKAPMAPRIGRGADRQERAVAAKGELMRQLRELRDKVEANCEYVGDRFAEEARRIHYGEREAKGIYGETTDREADALREEGIEFARIPWLPRTDG